MTKTTKFTDACAYSCKPGFKYVSGDQKRVCQHDGTWSGVELVCKGKTKYTHAELFRKIYFTANDRGLAIGIFTEQCKQVPEMPTKTSC